MEKNWHILEHDKIYTKKIKSVKMFSSALFLWFEGFYSTPKKVIEDPEVVI